MIKMIGSVEDKNLRLELWGGSTKHPDSVFHFNDFQKNEWFAEETQVFQWLLECASKLTWPFHAYELAEYAINYEKQREQKRMQKYEEEVENAL